MSVREVGWSCLVAAAPLVCGTARGREYDLASTPDDHAELAGLVAAGELDAMGAEVLGRWLDEPLELNRADADSLQELPGVTRALAEAVVSRRRDRGGYRTLAELREVPGLTAEVFEALAPFVTLAPTFDDAGDPTSTAAVEAGALWRREQRLAASGSAAPGVLGFARGRADAGDLGASVLLVRRRTTAAVWDFGRGQLVTSGPRDGFRIEQAEAHLEREGLRVVLGSFRLGFGERLVLGVSAGREEGWAPADRVALESSSGRVRVRDALFGSAATIEGPEVGSGRLGTTVFVSRQRLPAYQYRGVDWGYDDGNGACARNADCRPGYTCEAGACRTTRVYDARAPAVDPATGQPPRGLGYLTLDDAFWETLAGAHVGVRGDVHALGLTAYAGWTDILLAAAAHPRFVQGAAYPAGGRFGAVGADGQLQLGAVRLGGEAAWAGDLAVIGRAVLSHPLGETAIAVRGYGEAFENPRSRAEAASDLDAGLSRRNEVGARVASTLGLAGRVRTAAELDVWRPVAVSGTTGGALWRTRGWARMTVGVGDHEHVGVLGRYRRSASGSGGDDDAPGPASVGTRSSLGLTASTTRAPGVAAVLSASLTQLVEPGARERLGVVRLRVAVTAWPGGALTLAGGWARRLSGDARELDPSRPDLEGRVTLSQAFGAGFDARLRYEADVWSGVRTSRRAVHAVEVLVGARL